MYQIHIGNGNEAILFYQTGVQKKICTGYQPVLGKTNDKKGLLILMLRYKVHHTAETAIHVEVLKL
jgi:hypothetical protein